MAKTGVGVFIIESTRKDEEDHNRQEGQGLLSLLRLVGVPTTYRYIRTTKELKVMLEEFMESDYRYLHLSCHGDDTGFELRLEPDVSFEMFANMFPKGQGNRRLFLSVCGAGVRDLAKALKIAPFMSVVGPPAVIGWSKSAAFWASFYHLMLNRDDLDQPNTSMSSTKIRETVERLTGLFDVTMNAHFCSINRKRVYSYYYPESGADAAGHAGH